MNRINLVATALNSHEIVRRQLEYMATFVTAPCELILVDDGSNPPLQSTIRHLSLPFPLTLYATNDWRPWTQPRARNIGGRLASGDCLIFFDIDHIVTPEIIDLAASFNGDMFHWRRKPGNLSNSGKLEIIEKPAQNEDPFHEIHLNSFSIKRIIWDKLKGYDEKFCGSYGGDDVDFLQRYHQLVEQGEAKPSEIMGTGYVFSNSAQDTNLFHDLPRNSNSTSQF